jgi:branched-chain amino acid transport system ATP-binding protein
VLQVEDIHTYYGASHILQGMSLTLERGEVVAVIGRNGVGKTTLVRSIVGLTPAQSGRIVFKDTDITHMPAHRIARMGVGLVPQGRRIFPSLSVREHLEVAARRRGAAQWTLERMLALFPNLAARLGQTANKLSGGEQQMLAAGRALVGNPDLLLMDEPTEGLAPLIVEALTQVLLRLRAAGGLSIVLVEQNSRVALAFSERTVVMDKGRIAYDGASARLRDDPDYLASLIAAE